ncbi:MAG: hypothetical protein AVDCRST_MAG87-663, partial [uncultured Thermomicrobiales bacterium]
GTLIGDRVGLASSSRAKSRDLVSFPADAEGAGAATSRSWRAELGSERDPPTSLGMTGWRLFGEVVH